MSGSRKMSGNTKYSSYYVLGAQAIAAKEFEVTEAIRSQENETTKATFIRTAYMKPHQVY
jgi:hypothetical protein